MLNAEHCILIQHAMAAHTFTKLCTIEECKEIRIGADEYGIQRLFLEILALKRKNDTQNIVFIESDIEGNDIPSYAAQITTRTLLRPSDFILLPKGTNFDAVKNDSMANWRDIAFGLNRRFPVMPRQRLSGYAVRIFTANTDINDAINVLKKRLDDFLEILSKSKDREIKNIASTEEDDERKAKLLQEYEKKQNSIIKMKNALEENNVYLFIDLASQFDVTEITSSPEEWKDALVTLRGGMSDVRVANPFSFSDPQIKYMNLWNSAKRDIYIRK